MTNIYKESIFSTNIQLRPNEYNQSINETLLEKLKKKVEGKCDKNGFIKPDSAGLFSNPNLMVTVPLKFGIKYLVVIL